MMSDQKRANLITVDGSKKTKQKVTKTIRISLDLFESNEKECPEFNYKELVRAEEGRRRAEKEKKGGTPNGLRDPFSDNDEDVERIAKQFEQKYGGSSTYGRSKGRCKQDDYADIGAGYDENDSFIDNTDGYDEMIPPECDTVCGGFYINSGSLEFKNITGVGADLGDSSPPSHRKTHKRALSSSESEEESSSSDDDSDASTGEKQEEGDARNGKSSQVTDSDKSGEDGKKTKPAKVKDAEGKDGLPRKKRKNSQDEVGANQEPASASSTVKKTVKELLAEARANIGMDNNVEASTDSRSSDSSCKAPAVPSSDNPISSDSSRDAVPAVPPPASAPAAPPLPPLPPELPPEAATLARRLKALADAHFSSHTGKLSGSEVNDIILGMEKHCRRGTVPPSVRHALFSHAAALLRRGKPGLIQRARRLADEHQRASITRMPLDRLKEIIEKMQTALLENYRTESQRIIETNKQIVFQNSTLDDDKKIPEKRLPKRRFPWNDQVRAILSELVKSHGVSEDEEAMSRFLQSIVLPLFPSGFVRMPTLLQQAKLGKTPKSLKVQNKSMESKHTANSQQNSFNKPSNKTIDAAKFSQPAERSISDPESVVPVQPRPRPPTSSICVGTDVKDTDSKIITESNHVRNDLSPNQPSLDPEKNKSFKVHNDGRSASPMIGDNVSISVTSVFQKKNEAEKSSPSPPKTDKYIHPNSNSSLTITPVPSTHRDSNKQLSQTPVKVSNSVTITANPPAKPGDNSSTGPAAQPSISPGSIKVKSANALFDKNTIAKIISGKNTHDLTTGKVDGGKDAHRMKSHPDHHSKSGEKTSKMPHVSSGIDLMKPNILPTSPLPMLTKTYLGTSEPKLSSEDYSKNDLFVKPKYKTDHASHHQRSPSNTLPNSQSNYHKSPDTKNTDINKYQNDIHKSPHDERSADTLNLSPASKHADHLPASSAAPHASSYVLKQHRIHKKYDSLQMGMLAGPNNQKEGSSQQKLNFGDNLSISKSGGHKADVLNVDDSSSDDCVEVVGEDGPSTDKPVTSVLRDDDAKRRDIIRQQVEKQYKMFPDKPFERSKNDFSIKSIVKENAYSVKNILKTSHTTEHDVKKHSVESAPQSVIHSKPDSVLKYPSTRKTPDPEGEPEPKKYKLDSLGDSEPFQRLEGRSPQIFSTASDNIKCEPVSVIKDNFMSKSDRFMDRIHETSGAEEKESATEQELDVNTVMQDIKSLQDFQMCSSDALHQRQFDDASNKIFRAGPYPSESNPAIFNNKNFVSNENLLKKQSHFMETPSSHNLTTGSLH